MNKLLMIVIGSMLFLSACGQVERKVSDEDVKKRIEEKTVSMEEIKEKSDEPTQEELNEKLKADAVELDFVDAIQGEIEKGTRVKLTGKADIFMPGTFQTFSLTTIEGNGYGIYNVINFDTTEAEFQEGDQVTIYGTFKGEEEGTGLPEITAIIIEPVE
ncbi:hypothetical protein [Bhargavaea beijingensis]|uniref:hypothetical protein n=1 Tax=Bhargavaea beijingensis TaxID=426756 RepID=UPI002224572C|nr:hypothetical protein [Bhargavaea beijingensis]MCW1929554.1 hypothetical protein [Bhargavaea beijingensis]